MEELIRRKLDVANATSLILNKMPAIIEAFVTFYGESERANIESKFKNMQIICYCPPSDIKETIEAGKRAKRKQLIDQYLISIQRVLQKPTSELITLFFGVEENDGHIQMGKELYPTPIESYIAYKNGSLSGIEKIKNYPNAVRLLRGVYPDINEQEIDEVIESGKVADLNECISLYLKMVDEYRKYELSFVPYISYNEKCQQLEDLLRKSYLKKIIAMLADLFTKEELEKIDSRLGMFCSFIGLTTLGGKISNFFGISFEHPAPIEAFSKESETKLQNSSRDEQLSIKQERIKYFKNLGIDLGDDYEAYVSNQQTKAIWPTPDLAQRVKSTREQTYREMINEYYQSLPEYQENRRIIDALGLINKDDEYNAATYFHKRTQISANLRRTETGVELFPIMVINTGSLTGYEDQRLLHELQHAYEMGITSFDEKKYSSIAGWDEETRVISKEAIPTVSLENHQPRERELLSEVINELIGQEVHGILNQMGCFIFNDEFNTKIAGGTTYENANFLVHDFYEKYKKAIIASRKPGNISVLYEAVGKENYDALNGLVNEFHQQFRGFAYSILKNEIETNQETSNTRKYNEFVARRDRILAKMEEHSQTRGTKT